MSEQSIFSRIASLVTVRDLLTPLGPDLQPDDDTDEAESKITDMAYKQERAPGISLVKENNHPIGWYKTTKEFIVSKYFTPDNEQKTRLVREFTEPISQDSIVTADTSYFNAVEAFSKDNAPDFFFIIESNEVMGTLNEDDLYKLPARLCIFSLTLELEQLALELCQTQAEKSWNSLPPARKRKIFELYSKRNANLNLETLYHSDLLEATMFCDKGTILSKAGLLPSSTAHLVKRVFGRADDIRNACAHTGAESRLPILLSRNRLYHFIIDCHRIIEPIQKALAQQPTLLDLMQMEVNDD